MEMRKADGKGVATNNFTTVTGKHSLAAASGLSWESVFDGERQLVDYLSVELDLLILLSCCRRWLWQPEKSERQRHVLIQSNRYGSELMSSEFA